MASGKFPLRFTALAASLVLAACSQSSSGKDPNRILSALQDLSADATGQTTVVTFQRNLPANLGPGNFEADGGQLATGVMVTAKTATVTWDDRVTPSDQIRAVGFDTNKGFVSVTTSDAAAPTFTITGGTQTSGLGGDTITVQFSGANVVEATAEDPANWTLRVNSTSLDLSGSTFDLVPATQVMTITLGTAANLHASFDLAPSAAVTSVADVSLSTTAVSGTASGDTTAPTLVSAVQNLTESEFGFVCDFTFSEAMDPVFSTNLFSFDAGFPVFATLVEQPSDEVLRVTFSEPVIPGIDSVSLSSLMDAHGNALVDLSTAIAAGSTVANAFSSGAPTVDTVANTGGDTITAVFVQAIDPATAEEPGRWMLESPTGTAISLANASLSYDLMTKTLTVVLSDDDLTTGDTFTFGSTGAGSGAVDVDGEDFLTVVSGTVTGDATGPMVTSVTQNRQFDPSGLTYELTFSEDVDTSDAETAGNYSFSGAGSITNVTLLAGLDVVRITLSDVAVPGVDDVGISGISDLAGNSMTPQTAVAITSTDTTAPAPVSAVAKAVAGEDNDTLTVVFSDLMLESEVTDLANWQVQTPQGTLLTPLNGTVTWDGPNRTATLVFDGGDDTNLQYDDDFNVTFVTMHDVGGNLVDGTLLTGPVDAESQFPTVETVWVEDAPANTNVHVRFSEPCSRFDVAGGLTSYVLRDPTGLDVGGGTPVVSVDADKLGATLSFALAVVPGFHTLDVRGVTDLAGNQVFPVSAQPILAADSAEVALDSGNSLYTAVSGEKNDTLDVTFDRRVSSWGLFDSANYSLTDGSNPADFTGASFAFDGDRTVSITFTDGYAFGTGPYTLTVQNVLSAQGVAMTASSTDTADPDPSTDVTAPSPTAGRARLDAQSATDSVLFEFDEAIDPTEGVKLSNYLLGGSTSPSSATLLGPRTVRLVWSGGVSAGQTIDVTMTDLAQNAAGLLSEVVQSADTAGPAVSSVAGVANSGVGGDQLVVTFNQPVGASALEPTNYSFTVNGTPLDLNGAVFSYHSSTTAVTISLADGFDFKVGDTISATVSNVLNHAGLAINPPASVNGSVGGDVTVAPSFSQAFVNYRASSLGTMVDVRFDEDVDLSFATDPANYTVLDAGGAPVATTVTAVSSLRDDVVRLTLSAPLQAGEMLQTSGLPDPAGNLSGTIAITPTL